MLCGTGTGLASLRVPNMHAPPEPPSHRVHLRAFQHILELCILGEGRVLCAQDARERQGPEDDWHGRLRGKNP